jgi:hypothetical protein
MSNKYHDYIYCLKAFILASWFDRQFVNIELGWVVVQWAYKRLT